MPHYFSEPIVLRGYLITRLTDEDFLDFCRANPRLRLTRDGDRHILVEPAAAAGAESAAEDALATT